MLHAARCKCSTQKVAKNRHLGTIPQLCRAISSQLRHVSTIGKKNLLSSSISSTCPHNMVNFSPLAAEIVSLVLGTPVNFNVFHVLAALLHGTLVVGVSQSAALNRGRHLYLAGRARWALAHILVVFILYCSMFVFRMSVRFCCVRSSFFSTGWEERLRSSESDGNDGCSYTISSMSLTVSIAAHKRNALSCRVVFRYQ